MKWTLLSDGGAGGLCAFVGKGNGMRWSEDENEKEGGEWRNRK